jgi:outer membrane biosynthesis protein TonB
MTHLSTPSETDSSPEFDPYFKWLGIPPDEQPPNHYRLLAIPPFTSDPEVIENAADQRMAHLRSVRAGKRGALSQALLDQVAQAKVCLLDPNQKSAYDESLRAALESPGAPLSGPTEGGFQLAGQDVAQGSVQPKASRKTTAAATELIKIALGGIAGLALAYLVICWISPANDFLGVFAKNQPDKVAPAEPTPIASANEPPKQVPAAAPEKQSAAPKVQPEPARVPAETPSPPPVVDNSQPSTSEVIEQLLASIPKSSATKVNAKGQLIGLHSGGVALTDSQLDALASTDSLQQLYLPRSGLTDAGLEKLSRLPQLTILGIWSTEISSEGMQHVARLRKLDWLSVEGNHRIDDQGVAQLSVLTNLSHLGLSWTSVTDDGLGHLVGLPSLRTLDLNHTKITDRGLEHLAQIQTLKRLSIKETVITEAGVAKFREALPNCEVVRLNP